VIGDSEHSATEIPKAIMKKTFFGVVLSAMLFALCASALAQQMAKMPLVCFLSIRSGIEFREEAFRQGLRQLGYIEGKNIRVEWRFAHGKTDKLPRLAAELSQIMCDVIVAGGSVAVEALKNASTNSPVVFTIASDPIGAGLVASLSRPGGNITGLSLDAPGLAGKRIEILKESVSRLSRVAVLYQRASPASKVFLAESNEAARALRVQLYPHGVETKNEIEDAFKAMTKVHAEGLVKLPSGLLTALRKPIVELAVKNRLPAIYEDSIIVEDGGLMSYGPDITDLYRRSAIYVDKILKGAKPADLPVEQPVKFELIINLKAAKQIGLAIPPNVLARADKVIR
jgi:putative tryptophan/tyrosine transport system substrate-binding protein